MDRRTFIRGALRTAGLVSAGGALGLSSGLEYTPGSLASTEELIELCRLEEIVRKMTAMPAAHLGFVRRGMLKVGWAADVCVFDPERVIDKATFTEPAVYPEGIRQVVVNGEVVVEEGRHTGRLPGKVLRKNSRGAVA